MNFLVPIIAVNANVRPGALELTFRHLDSHSSQLTKHMPARPTWIPILVGAIALQTVMHKIAFRATYSGNISRFTSRSAFVFPRSGSLKLVGETGRGVLAVDLFSNTPEADGVDIAFNKNWEKSRYLSQYLASWPST